jgi:hypothetical protein
MLAQPGSESKPARRRVGVAPTRPHSLPTGKNRVSAAAEPVRYSKPAPNQLASAFWQSRPAAEFDGSGRGMAAEISRPSPVCQNEHYMFLEIIISSYMGCPCGRARSGRLGGGAPGPLHNRAPVWYRVTVSPARFCPATAALVDGGSSNGRTADSDSASLGSNPSPPAN